MILVTGGMGFIGSHIVDMLRNMKESVIIVDSYNKEYPGFAKISRGSRGIEDISELEMRHRANAWLYRKQFYMDSSIVKKFVHELKEWPHEEPKLIINCGNLSEAILSQEYNRFCFESMVSSMKKIKELFPKTPVIHMSSSMVYGSWEGLVTEEDSCNPVDWYGTCKLMTEGLLDKEKDVILRPIHVFGYGDGKFPITMNIERQHKVNKPVKVEKAGCIYIHDLVYLIRKIVANYKPGIYNVGSGYIREGEIVKNYAKSILGLDIEVENKLGPTGKARGDLNVDKVKRTFDWQPNFKTYEKAIEHYFREFNENYSKK